MSLNPCLAIGRLENSVKPAESEKNEAGKGEDERWAMPFIGCAKDTEGLLPLLALRPLVYGKPIKKVKVSHSRLSSGPKIPKKS